jgi:hypothetical protein
MATTTTLIEAANRVLLDVGERSVTSLTSTPAARKAKAYLQDAFNDLQMFHNWEWAYALIPLNSFTNEQTTIDNCRRIRNVYWDNGTRSFPIKYVPLSTFLQRDIYGFDSGDEPATRPTIWARVDEATLRFHPYPTDEDGRDSIRVEGIKYFPSPQGEGDSFPCPERFMPIIIKRASYMMYMRHLGDLNMAQYLEGEYMRLVQSFREQETITPTRAGNMFSNGR